MDAKTTPQSDPLEKLFSRADTIAEAIRLELRRQILSQIEAGKDEAEALGTASVSTMVMSLILSVLRISGVNLRDEGVLKTCKEFSEEILSLLLKRVAELKKKRLS